MHKIQLAHEYAKSLLKRHDAAYPLEELVRLGWVYADAMIEEELKRMKEVVVWEEIK